MKGPTREHAAAFKAELEALVSELDNVPDAWRRRLIVGAATRLADAAYQAGFDFGLALGREEGRAL